MQEKKKSGMGELIARADAPKKEGETKPVKLHLGLNLDVELELKARIVGDVTVTLL